MVVAGQHQGAAHRRSARPVAVLERIAAAVHARPLAVPQAEDTIHPRAGEAAGHLTDVLRAPQRRGRQVFVDARQEMDVVLLQLFGRGPQRHVQRAQRRAAVAGNEARGAQAGGAVAPALLAQQVNDGVGAGKQGA